MAMRDITRTGAQNFRELQLENDDNFAKAVASRKEELLEGYNNFAKTKEFDPFENAPKKLRSPLYGTSAPWGSSVFDKDTVNANEFEQLQDIRANNQPGILKLTNGIIKGVGLAGSVFLDGTIGLVAGITEAISDRDISKLWNNEISNGLSAFNKAMEEYLPNYRTEEEQNGPWYKNLGTVNFWADSFIKNLGFTVGALYSGGAWTKGIKAVGKGIELAGKGLRIAEEANKAAQLANKVTKGAESLGIAMQTSGMGAKITGSFISAVNEARIEANNNTSDLRDLQVQQATDAYDKKRQEIMEDESLSDEEAKVLLEEANKNYYTTINQIDENLKKAGLVDFLLNIPVLMADNFFTFGKVYAQNFSNAKNVASKNVKKSISQAADEAENALIKNTKKEADRYSWKEITKKESLRKGIATSLREGNEELAQAMAAEIGGNLVSYKDNPDVYYRAMSDPEALKETMDSWEAISKAFSDTYGNIDRYEEFAVGALTGLLGTPTFGRSQNASANTYLGRNKMIGLSGGIFGQFKSDAEMNKIGNEHIDKMNAALDKRDKIDKTARIHAAMSQFNDTMNGFAEKDDKFEFNNASDNMDWMAITSFISTGRENDLKALLSQDFDNITDEELESIAAATAQNDGSNIGGFREKGSGKLITANSPQEDKDAMRRKLKENRDRLLDEIDSYKRSVDLIRNYAAGSKNVSEDEVNELSWLHWKTSRFNSRANEIKKDNEENFTIIAEALNNFIQQQDNILNTPEEKTEGLSASEMSIAENKNAKLSKSKENARDNKYYASLLLDIIKNISNSNKNVLPFLAPLMVADKDFLNSILTSDNFYNLAVNRGITKPEFDKVIRDIRDLSRLAEANKTFNDKLKEYFEDPFKQKKDRNKIDKENKVVADEVNKEAKRKRAKNVTRQQILNGEVDAKDVINDTNKNDIERTIAKDAEATIKVSKNIESTIAKQQQDGTLSSEDAEIIEATIKKAIDKSSSINDLTKSDAAFMVDANGQPLSDEQISLILDIVGKAMKEVAEAEGLNFNDGTIDFNKVEEAIKSKEEPSSETTDAVDEIIDKEDEKINNGAIDKAIDKKESETTGNDTIDKVVASNPNGVQGNRRSRSKKNNKQSGKKNNQNKKTLKQLDKEKEAVTKAAKEKAKKENEAKQKNNTISAALIFGINGNAININSQEGKDAIQLLTNILGKAYDLINEGKLDKLSDIIKVLKAMDEYEKLQELLGREPSLGSALKSISDNLNRQFESEKEPVDESINIEETIGPNTINNEKVDPTDYNTEELNPAINLISYISPATSQFYRDPKTGKILNVPYYEKKGGSLSKKRQKLLSETYSYLFKKNAFKNASEVKVGTKVYFVIDPKLNEAAGDVVILMATDPEGKNIIGDLADSRSATYNNSGLFKDMIDRITEEFNKRPDKDSTNIFASKETSRVRQTMVGHIMFSNSDMSLNDAFAFDDFYMGVINRVGEVIVTNKGDESVQSGLNIVTPKRKFKSGTPVVLIPSGKGTNKYIAVPFQMNRYNSSMKGNMFDDYVHSLLKRVLLNNNGEPLDLSNNNTQILIKNALNSLFNGNFHVNFSNGQLVIHQVIKTVKNGVEESSKDYIFRGSPTTDIVSSLVKALQSKNLIIRIDRREINKKENLKDLGFSYNTMMGEIAHTNLSPESVTTVNDWFIVNPLNKEGKEISIDSMPYRDGRTDDNSTQKNVTEIEYNDKKYLVSDEGVIVDKKGLPRTDINAKDQAIILAKHEVENNDFIIPIGTEGEQLFWYNLSNGSLFYNKKGKERVVTSEREKQEVRNSFINKQDKNTTQETDKKDKTDTTDNKESKNTVINETKKYPNGFNNQELKDFFDSLPKDRQKILLEANPNAIASILPDIKEQIKCCKGELDDIDEDEIDNIFDRITNTKFRKATNEEEYTPIDLNEEIAWLKKVLPQLSDEDHLRIVKGLIKITGRDNPGYAYGKTTQGIMTISEAAAKGTVYHEAFHSVIDVLLDNDEIESLFEAGSKRYNIDRDTIKNEISIEEKLAEDFRKYVQKEQRYQEELKESKGISKVFKILKHTAKTWLDNMSYINNMFYRINKGQMANRGLTNNRNTERFNQYTDEERAILDNAPRDSQGRLLAPNGKVSNLTEKQYAQVRTKAFKEWFGDWENDPDNASKVVDENGEPLVVYHGNRTDNKITTFDPSKKGTEHKERAISGFWFTTDKDIAKEEYALKPESKGRGIEYLQYGEVIPVFLNIKNPIETEQQGITVRDTLYGILTTAKEKLDDFINRSKALAKENTDGYILTFVDSDNRADDFVSKQTQLVVNNPNQIKSATDNVGTFDANNPDIRYREATITPEDIQQYHIEKVDYSNLDDNQKSTLNVRGVTEETYSFLTQSEKENILMCLI